MICEDKECCGCGGCVEVCPQNCIRMRMNEEGFYYPIVDGQKCIACSRCKEICPINSRKRIQTCTKAYAMIYKENRIRKKSASGGMFYVLAKKILDLGGVVFGAALSEDCKEVKCIKVEELDRIHLLMGSKYVQCSPPFIYTEVKEELRKGRKVLFSGTPCQVNACINFLSNENRNNLFTVDLICHGVPSPGVWKKYLEETVPNAKEVYFRDKTEGWKKWSLKIVDRSGSIFRERETKNIYIKGFLRDLYSRISCYNCQFKGLDRCSDITLGDFWNVERYVADADDDMGTSLVFTHTSKGEEMIRSMEYDSNIYIQEVKTENVSNENKMLHQSVALSKKRKKFFKQWKVLTVEDNVNKCLRRGFFSKIMGKIKWIIFRK